MKIIYAIGVSALLIASISSCKNRPASQMQNIQYVDTIHTSKNSVNWDGVYEGIVPCADCEGISVQITLHTDETFQLSYQYLSKNDTPYSYSGKFTWDDRGGIITLDCNNFASHYLVGENKLLQLDMDKKRITGELASMYELIKK